MGNDGVLFCIYSENANYKELKTPNDLEMITQLFDKLQNNCLLGFLQIYFGVAGNALAE